MKRVLFSILSFITVLSINAQEAVDSVADNTITVVQEKDDIWPRHYISAGVGPAWITSEVRTDFGKYTWKNGWEYSVEYSCVFRKGFGVGLSFMHNSTSIPFLGDMKQTYIGPTFIYENIFGERWKFRTDLSLGYTHFKDNYEEEDGFGDKASVSMEYMFSDIISMGVRMVSGGVFFGDEDPYYDSKGITRFAIMAGISIRLF